MSLFQKLKLVLLFGFLIIIILAVFFTGSVEIVSPLSIWCLFLFALFSFFFSPNRRNRKHSNEQSKPSPDRVPDLHSPDLHSPVLRCSDQKTEHVDSPVPSSSSEKTVSPSDPSYYPRPSLSISLTTGSYSSHSSDRDLDSDICFDLDDYGDPYNYSYFRSCARSYECPGSVFPEEIDRRKRLRVSYLTLTGTKYANVEAAEALSANEELILEPTPSKHDKYGVRVYNTDMEPVGWIPKEDSDKEEIFRKLSTGIPVLARVIDVSRRNKRVYVTIVHARYHATRSAPH